MLRFTVAVAFHINWSLWKIIWTRDFEVREPFEWLIDYKDWNSWYVIVPKWFKTDLNSIPKIFRSIFDTDKVSWILHDYLYRYKKITFWNNLTWVTYKKCWFFYANWIYYKALRVEWTSRLEAILQFLWLCLWGWYTYFITYRNYERPF